MTIRSVESGIERETEKTDIWTTIENFRKYVEDLKSHLSEADYEMLIKQLLNVENKLIVEGLLKKPLGQNIDKN